MARRNEKLKLNMEFLLLLHFLHCEDMCYTLNAAATKCVLMFYLCWNEIRCIFGDHRWKFFTFTSKTKAMFTNQTRKHIFVNCLSKRRLKI